MPVVVTVHIKNVDLAKAKQVSAEHPELYKELGAIFAQHGFLGHRRLVNGNEIMDLDEWESEEDYKAAVAEAKPIIDQLNALRGNDEPIDTVWQIA